MTCALMKYPSRRKLYENIRGASPDGDILVHVKACFCVRTLLTFENVLSCIWARYVYNVMCCCVGAHSWLHQFVNTSVVFLSTQTMLSIISDIMENLQKLQIMKNLEIPKYSVKKSTRKSSSSLNTHIFLNICPMIF